jgi:GH43 family beta-xylosidase
MHGTFRNPLILGDGADPWIVYHDGYYYLTRTGTGTSLQIWQAASLAEFRRAEPVTVWRRSLAGTPTAHPTSAYRSV